MTLRAAAGAARRRAVAVLHALDGTAERARRRLDGSCALVLMYHRVLPSAHAREHAVEPGMYVSPETFSDHMAWLQEYFEVMPLAEVVTRLTAGQTLPERACAITFDDGWRDNLVHALPVLEASGLPATIFVVTERVGTLGAFWPDEVSAQVGPLSAGQRAALAADLGFDGDGSVESVLARLKGVSEAERPALLERIRLASSAPPSDARDLLDWSEIDALSRRGVDIEAHGATHAILTGLLPHEVEGELASSLATLRERGHARNALLAYPSGAFDASIARVASRVGYAGAVTTQVGLACPRSDPLALPRVGLHEDISRTKLEFLRFVPGDAVPIEGIVSA